MKWALGRYLVVTVEGWSMYPAFGDGDRLLVRRVRKRLRGVVPGVVVLIVQPDVERGWDVAADGSECGWFVKRVTAVAGDPVPSAVVVVGDHPRSRDSKQHGWCPAEMVAGTVLRRIEPGTSQVPGSVSSPTAVPGRPR